ncbi:high affinity immunoglobulin gamma Fc receptor I-like isoform X2 [Betta splendens]|uniref:high affinity immunoglobulin gamma Fc receptor I-like isoform X2 n=1 Tax=Betta splendens TaxID=158456 RepID=UPI0010F5ED2D|nr:high affinity immunoglobulin gamma Fc receptor I-like isoform X2 [Betta splendens]
MPAFVTRSWDRMQLTPFCLMLTCLRVHPDRAQFFRYDNVTLSCQDARAPDSSGWTVRRETVEGGVRRCSSGWGVTSSGSTCVIRTTYPTDSGLYWCESEDGERSNGVNITITDRAVILESPGLPVPEASAVSLRCRADSNSTGHVFSFYRDGRHIGSSSTAALSIGSAARSHQGLYTCSVRGAASAGSWLHVEGASGATDARPLSRAATALPPSAAAPLSTSNATSPPAASACVTSVIRLSCYLVVGPLYLLSTVVLGLTCRNRKKDQGAVDRTGSTVVVEVVV